MTEYQKIDFQFLDLVSMLRIQECQHHSLIKTVDFDSDFDSDFDDFDK